MIKGENWIKLIEVERLKKLEENIKTYSPIEELLKEHKIDFKYKIEEELDYNNNVKNIKYVYSVNLYVKERDEKKARKILEEYKNAEVIEEELKDVEDEVVTKTIPSIILPYIYVVLFGIIIIIMSFANFKNISLKILGIVLGIIVILYAIKIVIQKILKPKK